MHIAESQKAWKLFKLNIKKVMQKNLLLNQTNLFYLTNFLTKTTPAENTKLHI